MAAGFKPAARINRDLTTESSLAVHGELTSRSFPAKPEVFDCTDLRDRKAVVNLHHIDILVREFCHFERTLACCDGRIEGRDVAPVMERDGITGL